MITADFLDYHSFLPSRTPVRTHAFTDVLRVLEYQAIDLSKVIKALSAFYLCPAGDVPSQSQSMQLWAMYDNYWRTKDRLATVPLLYFTLLMNQYLVSECCLPCWQIIQPCMREYWGVGLPMLRGEPMQFRLLQTNSLSLCLKINSHWVFSDMMTKIYIGQPQHCLPEKYRDSSVVDPLLGMSPKLFNILANTTRNVAQQQQGMTKPQALYDEAHALQQNYPTHSALNDYGKQLMEDVASAYAQTVMIYILCRLHRYAMLGRPVVRLNVQVDYLPLTNWFHATYNYCKSHCVAISFRGPAQISQPCGRYCRLSSTA